MLAAAARRRSHNADGCFRPRLRFAGPGIHPSLLEGTAVLSEDGRSPGMVEYVTSWLHILPFSQLAKTATDEGFFDVIIGKLEGALEGQAGIAVLA